MMNNANLNTYEIDNSDSEMFGVDNIEIWYESRSNYGIRSYSAQEMILSMASDIQNVLDDPDKAEQIRVVLNRIKWITMNKLSSR